MGSRINSGINWSLSELKKLVNDKKSCVHFERARRHIALHPFHMTDLNKALHEILSSSINFHDLELKGLLLSYKNPKLLSTLGSILYDSHYVHVDIEADFYVFRPEIGSVLNGVVNKQATNYIGVLVHKAFNVSIPIYSGDDNDYEGHENYFEVGQDVEFTVTHVDFKGKLPFIKGKLLSDSNFTHDENAELPLSPSKHSKECVNGDNNVENSNNKNENDKILKPSKRPSFLSSILNESSDSNSENDTENIKKSLSRKKFGKKIETIQKSSPQKHDKITFEELNDKEKVKKKKTKSISTVKNNDELIFTPSNRKILNNDDDSDRNVYTEKRKKKSKKLIITDNNQSECESSKLNVREQNNECKNELSDETLSIPITADDKKPRIIHDRVLNTNERNIAIDRKPFNTTIRRRIFAHDISDSENEIDNYKKPLTQSLKLSTDEKNHKEKVKETINNGFKSTDCMETSEESENDLQSNKKIIMSNKSLKKKMNSPNNNIENKDHTKNKIRTTLEPENNYVDGKFKVKAISSENTDTSDTDSRKEFKKKLKKKLKNLTPEKESDHSIEFPSPSQFTKLENECVFNSLQKSRNMNESESENDNESTNSISPKKVKINKRGEIFIGNVRIKREPDSSDIDTSPKKKSDKKYKNYIMDNSDYLDQVQVKSESTIKKEKNKTKEMKRKYKDSIKVKYESGDSDLDTDFVPQKKIKTIFSE